MTAPIRPEPGTRLVFRWHKWDGSPHWTHECLYLGADEWGDWFGQPAGWPSARPGREILPVEPCVTLLPPSGDFVFTRNAPPHRTHTYIDLAWDARWSDDGEPVGVDMDLDVVQHLGEEVFVDDRDEWDEHRVQYGYPLDLVARLEDLALELEQRVRAGAAPFDEATADGWLARLAALTDSEERA